MPSIVIRPSLFRLSTLIIWVGVFGGGTFLALQPSIGLLVGCMVLAALAAATILPLLLTVKKSGLDDSRQLNVLIVVQNLEIGGLERMVLQLATALQQESLVDVTVLAYDQPGGSGKSLLGAFSERNIRVYALKKPSGFSPMIVAKIIALTIRHGIDIYHTQDVATLIYSAMAKIALLGQVRILHTQHSFIHLKNGAKYRAFERTFTRLADRVTVVSPTLLAGYENLSIPTTRIDCIPNGVSCDPIYYDSRKELVAARKQWLATASLTLPIHDQLWDRVEDLWLLCVARLYPGKGQDHILQLWNLLEPTNRLRALLIFVGPESSPGEQFRLESMAGTSRERERIIFAGPSDRPELWRRVADVFISASEYEGMPLGPLEAACEGLPCLLSEIPGHSVLKPYAHFFSLHRICAAAELLDALMKSLSECFERERASARNSAQILRQNHSIERMAQAYLDVYRSLLK